ncbi:MAG: DUF3140 domain-containing protein [Sporichthyaceae bacterium]
MAGTKDRDRLRREFAKAVNMSAGTLRKWLDSEKSQSVGAVGGKPKKSRSGGESVGHRSGRRIVELLTAKKGDLDKDDYAHMRKVVGYVKRHRRQRPSGDVETSRWRYSLMNWGHDPLKK